VKFKFNAGIATRTAVVLFAFTCGALLGVLVVPVGYLRGFRPVSISAVSLCISAAGLIAVARIGVWLIGLAENKQHRLDRDLLDTFLEHIPDNVFFKDPKSRFVRVSRSFARYIGLEDPAQVIHKTDAEVFSREHASQARADEEQLLRTAEPIVDQEEKETWPDGRETWVLTTKVAMKDRGGRIIGTMGIAHNITDRKQAELKVRHMALHDPLTGLPNRALLEDRLAQAIAQAGRNRKRAAVLMFDLDRFKSINDSFGHHIGDRLLESMAVRLKECLRKSDTIARMGGDEFVIAIPTISTTEEVELIATKVLTTLAEPFEIGGHRLQVSASIGICLHSQDGETPELLLQYADAAMYEAKRRGRNCYCFFSPAFTEATQRQQKLESELVHACARNEFVLHYQPFVDSKSGCVTGVESLVRWEHPELGLIPPSEFMPELEELDLIVEVGTWVLKKACHQAVEWQLSGIPPIRMAVNISSKQFYQEDFVDQVSSALAETGLKPELLELELADSKTLDDSELTVTIMERLKRIGVKLSLDDFGTGWSSLSYLKRFPLDRIKIDPSFVRDIGTDAAAGAVVKNILALGRDLGIDCVAEGVETIKQSHFLTRQACSEMQGFLFSPPLPAAAMTKLLCEVPFESETGTERSSRPIASSVPTPPLQIPS